MNFKFQTKTTIDIIIVVAGNPKILFNSYPAVRDNLRVKKIHLLACKKRLMS